MDTCTDCNVVSTEYRRNGGSACSYCSTVTSQFCLQLLQYCHITVTAVLSHHSSACIYCSTVTSQFYLQSLQYCHNPQSRSKQYVIFEPNINQRHFTMGNETLIPATESFQIVQYIPQPITQKPSQMFLCIK